MKDIENNINSKTDPTEKTKKITVKDFKENKRLLMRTEMYYIMYILNIKLGISLIDHLITKIINYLYPIQVMKFILNGKLIILLYKHVVKTTLLIKLKILLNWHLVIHIHTKLKC